MENHYFSWENQLSMVIFPVRYVNVDQRVTWFNYQRCGFHHQEWWFHPQRCGFSIVMLNYQRSIPIISPRPCTCPWRCSPPWPPARLPRASSAWPCGRCRPPWPAARRCWCTTWRWRRWEKPGESHGKMIIYDVFIYFLWDLMGFNGSYPLVN